MFHEFLSHKNQTHIQLSNDRSAATYIANLITVTGHHTFLQVTILGCYDNVKVSRAMKDSMKAT